MTIEIFAVKGLPIIKKDSKISRLICHSAEKQKTPIQNGDILVVTHVIVSRAEGYVVDLDKVEPSEFAKTISKSGNKDPALVEVVLREAEGVIRMRNGNIITLTKHGFICANSGVDKSNVPGERKVALLPKNPDESARRIKNEVEKHTGKKVAVIISDTHGRPLRDGQINIAIGVAGFKPIRDRRGEKDLFGYLLKVKRVAVADELACAAELVIGQANEGIPVAIIRGYSFQEAEAATAKDMLRPLEKELFV